MIRAERTENLNELLRLALSNWQSGIWTTLPAVITKYDPDTQTCEAQTMIQLTRRLQKPQTGADGKPVYFVPVSIPKLLDVPVLFPSGGGYSLTFPITVGDEVLIVFASRCIDSWWALGADTSSQNQDRLPLELRMHDLSDGFAILSPRSQKRLLSPAPSGNTLQLRSDDGQAIIEIAANHVINVTGANINVTATNTVTIKAATIILKNAGTTLKKLVNETFLSLFDGHQHPDPVSGLTGVPSVGSSSINATAVVQAE